AGGATRLFPVFSPGAPVAISSKGDDCAGEGGTGTTTGGGALDSATGNAGISSVSVATTVSGRGDATAGGAGATTGGGSQHQSFELYRDATAGAAGATMGGGAGFCPGLQNRASTSATSRGVW